MARRRTVDLLPEIFRTPTNRQFLGATLDQLTQEPNLKRTQGFIGRRVGAGVNPADRYVTEPTAQRADYQLEPGVVFFRPDTNRAQDAITYPGMIDALDLLGADTQRQDRLWQSEFYSWDPFCDLDKFNNYSQYFWLPQGPDSVDVGSTTYLTTDAWQITRANGAYQFSDEAGNNPVITLVRGGNYTFQVSQTGHDFWIQTVPGVDGRIPATPNISSRDVLGVINNGEDLGTVTFNVPLKSAQDFYFGLTELAPVDLVTTLKFNQINNIYVDQFLATNPDGIDGITNLNGRTVIFLNQIVDAQDGGWQITSQFDPLEREAPPEIITNGLVGSYDTTLFDQTTDIPTQAQRYSVWQINYIPDNDGNFYIQLASIRSVPQLTKFRIRFGTQYASTQWFKNASGYFEQIPLLTAVLDTLYYQDGTDPAIFGRIQLVDQSENTPINIDDIIGAQNYTSPNGVTFTNGLKVQFRGLTEPAQFQDLEYYVEGVGTGPGIDARVGFVDGEAYFGAFHVHDGQKMTGAQHTPDTFHQFIYDTIAESLANTGAGGPEGAPLPTQGVLNATLGDGIRLVPVEDFVTPETYTESRTTPFDSNGYDSTPFDETLNAPEVPDYITINRSAGDRNAWSRSNRWFHRDVIQTTADLNNQIAVFDERARGKRPIIEFRANLRLFNFGTQGKQPVDIIDFSATDAFSDINGQTGFSTDGYSLLTGSRVIFAADRDPQVRNRIYQVDFIDPDGDPNSIPIINLVPAPLGQALINQTVVCLSGNTQQGLSFWFDGADWQLAQQKTSVNQAPLFDVYDTSGHSLADRVVYPSTTFAGSKLFGYGLGDTQINDAVLGFPLKFLNFNNVGDILFENYLYTDTFLYVRDAVSVTEPVSVGFVRQYIDRVTFSELIGWQPAAEQSRSRQVFRFVYDDEPLVLDVPVDETSVFSPLQIFLGSQFVDPTAYTYEIQGGATVIVLDPAPATGTVIEVQVISDVASDVAFYQVPINLENNAVNQDASAFTLGTIRNHYQSIGQNLRLIQGPIDGANNTRDLGNILIYGQDIIQNSAPLSLTGTFLRQPQYEVIAAMEFNSREYQKFKARMMNLAAQGDFINSTPTQILDDVVVQMGLGRDNVSPFYWSDMMPAGENYRSTVYVYSPISTSVFDTLQTYDYTTSNYLGMNVYLNGVILTRGTDYTVGVDSATITVAVPLTVGDRIEIREFSATYGTYVPNTPSKMGLYPAYRPEIYLDTTYLEPTLVVRGHDGSITVAFGDYRDQVLLEFETRIFNNIKIVSEIPISAAEVIPGQFRSTDYTLEEVTTILSTDFLSWIGWNKLDYTSQTYVREDGFTWNYSQSANKLNRQPLLGAWRGIYNYFYDTITPNTRPWEMLGFSQEPDWWSDYYGPAPYTSGNLVLWDDLAQGLVRDPAGSYVLPQYARPDLQSVIPAGSEGELLPPIDVTTGNYDTTSFRRSWTFGDDGPVENVWRSSSAWPFAVMRLLALTRPAKFFGLFADRDRYQFDAALDQYLWDGRYRLDSKQLAPLYGNGVSRASYINWIIDYNRQLGANTTDRLEVDLANTDVRLCWRVGGFTDKRYLKIFAERSTPNSLNASLLLPDESYQILLYKNQPFSQAVFSSVVVQSTDAGWQVYGYSTTRPYFEILASIPNGNNIPVTAGGTTVRLALDHSDDVVQVPYGYTFTTATGVCDFLYSYGLLLERQGFVFDSRENGYILNWLQMCQEFLYWSGQGWAPGTIINLNPGATTVSVTQPLSVVDSLNTLRPENLILNQNRQPLPAADLVIERLDNTFRATSLTSNTINFLNARFTAYEHLVVLDNVSTFADLIYQPVTGLRQNRMLVSGWISGDWNGTVDAPGFVINEDNIVEWDPNQTYAKGEIVLFKNEYWAASTIIQPGQQFDYTQWIKSDYDEIQTGLLPNAPNASDQLATAYSVYDANLEQEVDLFSYGLIGFRPREYMQALNLDDVSQVGLYQQFLGTKGTIRSAELFSLADLGKETAQYDIYELWAMQRATYGATANRNYVELLLDQSRLRSDPSLIQVITPGEVSEADQTVLLQNIWKSSARLTSPDFLPTTITPVTENSLPSAGYVNLDDVDYTLFNLENPPEVAASLNQQLDELSLGDTIWVAKSNPHDWNVYRVTEVPGRIISVSDNLDGRALVEFSRQHQLTVNDYLIIKFFNASIDGTYRVVSVPGIQSVLIDLVFLGTQTTVTGTGVGFTLDSARVAQASDVVDLPYSLDLLSGARVWVDDNGQGLWTVLEKTNPFGDAAVIQPEALIENARFGATVTQGFQNLAAMVGAPGVLPGGAVYTYVRTPNQDYDQNIILTLDATSTAGFGSSMDMGDQTWAVIGAPNSLSDQGYAVVIFNPPTANAFVQRQLLVIPVANGGAAGDEFGYSVTVSNDERWLYVGAPGINLVHAYGRIDIQAQAVTYIGDGSTTNFDFSDHLAVTAGNQLVVSVNNVLQTLGTDYVATASLVAFFTAPAAGFEVTITRRSGFNQAAGTTYVADGVESSFDFTSALPVTAATQLVVKVNGATKTLNTDYTVSGVGNRTVTVVFLAPIPVASDLIEIIQDVYDLAPILTAQNIYSFSVYQDNVIQRPTYDYDFISGDLVFTQVPQPGVEIRVVSDSYWRPVTTITVGGLAADARFGHSVSTTTDGRQLLVGAPGVDSAQGRVYVFDRAAEAFQITNSSTLAYTTVRSLSSPGAPINVQLNGQFLLNQQDNVGGTFSIAGNTVTLATAPSVGDTLLVDTNQFTLVQTLSDDEPFSGAQYGTAVDQCINDCSLYIGAPFDGSVLPEAGHVEYQLNQSRVYGTILSTVANPTLIAGQYLRINDRMTELPSVPAHNSALSYAANAFVLLGGTSIYRALIAVPAGTAITDTTYWQATNWSAVMATAISQASLPNVAASLTADIQYRGDGVTTGFSAGTLYTTPTSYTTLVYVDNVLQSDPGNYSYDTNTAVIDFVTAPTFGSQIRIIGARLVLSVINAAAASPLDRLRVAPGTGTLFADLGFDTYVYTQTITSPVPQAYSHFGQAVFISDNTTDLVIGAPDGSAFNPCTFDGNSTRFDGGSTEFLDAVSQSGVVYTYDFLPAARASVTNPGQFVFGQQMYDSSLAPLDQFGTAIDYTTGTLLIGAPGTDSGDSAAGYGAVIQYVNATREPSWQPIRLQQPVVNIDLLNTVFMYDRFLGTNRQYFDFFDPLQGRVLGAVRQNLDYIGAIDPAAYNAGSINNYGDSWGQARVGEIWWNTTNARFIDPNQDDIVYASRRWGQLFPGSEIEVYQWIASTVPPAQYPGPGTPLSTVSYSITSGIDAQGLFLTTYFFWVTGIRTVDRAARKTLSIDTITRYIESPRSSGIAYIAPINASTIAIYNGLPYIQAEDTVLHVEYDQQRNQDAVHLEYQLIPQGRGDGFLTDSLYRKLQDSFCGVDVAGNLVPDPLLPPSELYGVEFRPRQSLFANRFLALENYLLAANRVMSLYPLAETRRFPLLDSEEPEPMAGSGAWNKRVANDAELSYQDLVQVPLGYLYLVESDAANDGLWTIYQVVADVLPGSRRLALVRVQNYDTKRYWQYVDWYAPGYDPLTVITAEVATFSDLETITVAPGSSVKVTANAQGRFEIYLFDDDTYTRVGLQSGTIAISPEIWDYAIGRFGFDVEVFDAQYFDQEPVTETRRIIQAINQEIFTGDLAIERNRLLMLMFDFILSEQVAPIWLTKTSLIDVDHVIRRLQPFQIYRQDNQDFVLNYIQEVKPYHTQIRQFNLIYEGSDTYDGTVTDFDLPAYWDSAQDLFISPVLDDDPDDPLSTTSSVPSTSPIWQTLPWNQWYQNYLLNIEAVTVVAGGTGYTVPPQVIVTGEAEAPAELVARINSAGAVIAIDVISAGRGYLTTAIITLEGGNGTGARAVAVMGNQQVREFTTTIKYDRYQYQTTIVPWQANVSYDNGTQVRYADRVWEASSDDSTAVETATFDPADWTLVAASSLSGVDRTMGFYAPTANQPGLDLALLISGVDYPGVQVSGVNFNQNTGFDVGNYDINPFDNISIGPEGLPTYDPAILDAIYESEFTDPYLGTLPAPAYAGDPPTTGPANAVTVAGGAFVDTYSSHAPEELVPGAIFDTLDFRVFTTPGADWLGDGHGFDIGVINYEYVDADAELGFGDQVDMLVMIMVYNISTGIQLTEDIQYEVDWVAQTLRIIDGAAAGDVISIQIYGLGGGNQLFRQAYTGAQPSNTITVPVQTSLISEFAIFINGDPTTNFTFLASGDFATQIVFGQTLTASDYVAVTALQTGSGSWSAPVQQYEVGDGITLIFPLANSLQGTNPANIIVEVNGRRVRPAEGVEHIADGSSLQYYLPTRGGYNQALIADNEVSVYLDGEPLIQTVDYEVDPYVPGQDRTITLTDLPAAGSRILISVNHAADYYISSTNLIFRPSSSILPLFGDIITITTFNDTSQQDILTQVFQGPTTTGILISEGYDTTLYDEATVSGTPGSYDFATGSQIQTNEFDTGRVITDASRLEVTLNGFYLDVGQGFVTDGTKVILLGTVIGSAEVVSITSYTQSVTPNAIAFRIFQDMRGMQSTYRITPETSTVLTQGLAPQADVIYVADASRLSEPNLPQGIFGLVTVNGERIAYRARDTVNNTVSGLRRGTAGTAAAEHAAGSAVYDIGLGNLLPAEYQDRTVFDNFLADGNTVLFVAEDITISDLDSTELVEAVEVYVGGILQTGGYTVTGSDPVTVVFATAPLSGYQVSIRVRRGESWYQPGINTASDGVPLQETNTLAARFIRGI